MSAIDIKDKVLFITGANRGIGKALVEVAVACGAKKVYASARDISKLDEIISKHADQVVAVELDVTNADHIQKAKEACSDVEVLINNAGVAGFSGFVFNYSEQSARQELDVNYFGMLNLAQAFAPAIINNKGGAMANVVSVAGLSCFPMAATYSASKAAAHSLTQGMRAELTPQGVAVFGIYPGPIDTDMADGVDMEKESPENVAKRVYELMKEGIEDITTDKFADEFLAGFKADYKTIEKQFGQGAYQP